MSEENNQPLPAASGDPAVLTGVRRYNTVVFPVAGTRTRQTTIGPIDEAYDRGMWPAVDWTTDNIIEWKIRHAIELERERCLKIAESAIATECEREDCVCHNAARASIAAKIRSGE